MTEIERLQYLLMFADLCSRGGLNTTFCEAVNEIAKILKVR